MNKSSVKWSTKENNATAKPIFPRPYVSLLGGILLLKGGQGGGGGADRVSKLTDLKKESDSPSPRRYAIVCSVWGGLDPHPMTAQAGCQHYKSGQALPEEAFRAAFSQPFTGVTTLSEVMQAGHPSQGSQVFVPKIYFEVEQLHIFVTLIECFCLFAMIKIYNSRLTVKPKHG